MALPGVHIWRSHLPTIKEKHWDMALENQALARVTAGRFVQAYPTVTLDQEAIEQAVLIALAQMAAVFEKAWGQRAWSFGFAKKRAWKAARQEAMRQSPQMSWGRDQDNFHNVSVDASGDGGYNMLDHDPDVVMERASAEDVALPHLQAEEVWDLISHLPNTQQQTFLWLYYGPADLTYQEIGDRYGLTTEGVRQSIKRGLEKLRRKLGVAA